MWNTVQHNETMLPNRILKDEVQNLRAYLSPYLLKKEQEGQVDKKKEDEYRERVRNWQREYKEKVMGISPEDEDDEDEEANESDIDLLLDDD